MTANTWKCVGQKRIWWSCWAQTWKTDFFQLIPVEYIPYISDLAHWWQWCMEAPSPAVDTARLSLRNAHYFFSQHANTDLAPGHFIQIFHVSSRHPTEAWANRRPGKGERETWAASVRSVQPRSWQEAACNFAAYTSIPPCCARRRALLARVWLLVHLKSHCLSQARLV